ncbi:hypothetical protein LDENG_00058350 [Lucifuga dentata]|nr:hypothetical protein LDENG_00058350 [Lucifuga dentata]
MDAKQVEGKMAKVVSIAHTRVGQQLRLRPSPLPACCYKRSAACPLSAQQLRGGRQNRLEKQHLIKAINKISLS